MTKNKYFDKFATITTKDNKIFNIRKMRIYIGGKINYYGKQYIITPEIEGKEQDFKIINDIYSFDNDRLRFLSDSFKKPIVFDTIEHSVDNSIEKPIRVIQEYDESLTQIDSISNIVKIESDLIIYENDKIINKTEQKQKRNLFNKGLILKK